MEIPRWLWVSLSLLMPLAAVGLTINAGIRARRALWVALGLAWTAAFIAGLVLNSAAHGHSGLAAVLILLAWLGATVTAISIRPAYVRQMYPDGLGNAAQAARQRLSDRRRALQLAAEDPSLAHEMGIGRPDLPGAEDAGLIDVNNASAEMLGRLPGVDAHLASQIVHTREKIGGFSSLEDLGETLDLDGGTVERMRAHAVFLPRS